MKIKIQRNPNGAVLGAALWVPGHIVEKCILPGQEEIEVAFEGNQIIIGKEESPAVQAGQREHHIDVDVHRLISPITT